MCENPATTKEHAPPRCIFPEVRDLPEAVDLRKGLITVPSCEAHNTAKSKDDEYFLYVLSASITSNHVGLSHFLSKVKRAAERRPQLSHALSRTVVPVQIYDEDNDQRLEAYALPIDGSRIDSILEKCARALYWHSTGVSFVGEVRVITAFLLTKENIAFNNEVAESIRAAETFFKSYPAVGMNPQVFTYKIESGQQSSLLLMEFYGLTKALVQFKRTC